MKNSDGFSAIGGPSIFFHFASIDLIKYFISYVIVTVNLHTKAFLADLTKVFWFQQSIWISMIITILELLRKLLLT